MIIPTCHPFLVVSMPSLRHIVVGLLPDVIRIDSLGFALIDDIP
jgi:hypothetical protein